MEPVAYDECFVPMSPSAASTVADDVGPEGSLGSRRSELPNEDTDGDAPTECPKGPADFLPSQGSTLLRAKALTKLALDAACNRPRAEEKSQVRRLREECQAARRRISCNASSVKATWATGRALEAALLQLEAARGRLRAARKGQQLAVCRQRLEAVNAMEEATDLLEALQTEREALQLLRRELDALDREVAASVEAGAELHGRLRKDLASRRRDLRAEEAGGVEFWARKAKQAEEEAKLLCRKVVETIQWTDLECCKASQAVQLCLARLLEQHQLRRRRYDAQLKELEVAISCATWTTRERPRSGNNNSESAEAQRARVILYELNTSQKHLKALVQQCKKNLRLLEACKNPALVKSTSKDLRPAPRDAQSGLGGPSGSNGSNGAREPRARPSSAPSCRPMRRSASAAELRPEDDLQDLWHLRFEERELRSELRTCEDGVERCAAWAKVLADLEDEVTETMLRRGGFRGL